MKKEIKTVEELIAEAKRRYPLGAIVRSRYDNDLYTITSTDFKKDLYANRGEVISSNISVYLFSDGIWSEVIKYPKGYVQPGPEEPVIINQFPIY
jgi:hypothetical protein